MKLPLKFAAVSLFALSAIPAQAYQVDCAILLCLSGGFPPSAECEHAKITMIRRIMPWPIEPPLQIWNCPLSVAYEGATPPSQRLWEIAFTEGHVTTPTPALFKSNGDAAAYLENHLHFVQQGSVQGSDRTADIDISGPTYDYIRSLKVYHVAAYSHEERGPEDDRECDETFNIQIGTYGVQGDFKWQRLWRYSDIPQWLVPDRRCQDDYPTLRGVGIEWKDYQGNPTHEFYEY